MATASERIDFKCARCGNILTAPIEQRGERLVCFKCGKESIIPWTGIVTPSPARPMFCTDCHALAVPEQHTPGDGTIEVILWLWLIVPGLIYSIWRHSAAHSRCARCKSRNVIPEDSPRARSIIG